jgi:aromatic ring-opening dioxygenase catalytic subunit (LigB family)
MLKKHGIDAIHVINRTNIWYQYPEFPDALRAIASAAAGHERISPMDRAWAAMPP